MDDEQKQLNFMARCVLAAEALLSAADDLNRLSTEYDALNYGVRLQDAPEASDLAYLQAADIYGLMVANNALQAAVAAQRGLLYAVTR